MSEETGSGMKPPISGALLEAMFAFDRVELSDVIDVTDRFLKSGCDCHRPEEWTGRTDGFEFIQNTDSVPLSEFVEVLSTHNVVEMNLFLSTVLDDQKSVVNLGFDFTENVISLSTPDSLLWSDSYSRDAFQRLRLIAFVKLCETICQARVPVRGVIGAETCHASEIGLSNPTDKFNFDAQAFFCEAKIDELARWYMDVYSLRWGTSIQIKGSGDRNGDRVRRAKPDWNKE